MSRLERLIEVTLREYWGNEASDFTLCPPLNSNRDYVVPISIREQSLALGVVKL